MAERTGAGQSRRGGRPRTPEIDAAIQEATLGILARDGYGHLSIEAVAQQAGISRPTVYRRYQNKADLVIDVISHIAARDTARFEGISPRSPHTGSLAADIEALFVALDSSFDEFAEQGIMPGFLADLIAHPDLARRFFSEYLNVAQQNVRSVFAEAADRGEIEAGPLPEVILSTFIGAYIYHRFVICQTFGAKERRVVAQTIARGLARRQHG